jgi:hypothetical protein
VEQSNGQQPPPAEGQPASSSPPPGWESWEGAEESPAGSEQPGAHPDLPSHEPIRAEAPLLVAPSVQLAPPASPLGWQVPSNPSRPEPQRTLHQDRPQSDATSGADVPRLQLAPPPNGYLPQPAQPHEQQAAGAPANRPLLAPTTRPTCTPPGRLPGES